MVATFRCEATFEVLPGRFVLHGSVETGVIRPGMAVLSHAVNLHVESIEFVNVARVEDLPPDKIGIVVRCDDPDEVEFVRSLDGSSTLLTVQ